jgi:hypothetical protein
MARYNPKQSTVYLRSQSGRTESFDQFRQRLRKLSTSETMRFREVRKLLLKEAQPLVTEARRQAYADSPLRAGSFAKTRGGIGYTTFMNLYSSIGKFANKGTEKAYVVVGLRSYSKRAGLAGAYYAAWQLFGGTQKDFKAKDFIGKAVDNTDVVQRAQKMMQRHIQKRITSVLR